MASARLTVLEFLKKYSVIRWENERITLTNGRNGKWLIDTRVAFLNPKIAKEVAILFFSELKHFMPCQLCCLELTGVPLMVALQSYLLELGYSVNGVIIRKDRKTHGRQRKIEGELNDLPIVFVDDILNSGTSVEKATDALTDVGRRIEHVISLIDFQVVGVKEALDAKGIQISTILRLEQLGLRKTARDSGTELTVVFECVWRYKLAFPNHYHVIPKSTPALDDTNLYIGFDSGKFVSLRQSDGVIQWEFQLSTRNTKGILSSPALGSETAFLAGYDGNFYCLNKDTGATVWQFNEADWIGSSPCLTQDAVIVGLEHALPGTKGSIVSLHLQTGEKQWQIRVPDYVHSGPLYVPSEGAVVVGTNEGSMLCIKALTGETIWCMKPLGPVKARAAFDESTGLVVFGSFDKNVYAVDISNGRIAWKAPTMGQVYCEPLIFNGEVYVGSTDKSLYVLDLGNGSTRVRIDANAKIYSGPSVIGDCVYFGATSGAVFQYNSASQELSGKYQLPEPITNKIVHNPTTDLFFASTVDGQIFALRRIH
jgi:orotate phosphoribosyltransferase